MAQSKTLRFKRTWRGGQIKANMRGAVPQATAAGAEFLRGQSLEQVPVETGALGDTFVVIPGSIDNPGAILLVDSIYAAAQHEVPMNHTPGQAGQPAGKDHYVSDPMRENAKAIYGIMAKYLKGALNG